jgi:hypothetical protein
MQKQNGLKIIYIIRILAHQNDLKTFKKINLKIKINHHMLLLSNFVLRSQWKLE